MKVLFVSLGCDKNLVDTEEMLGALRAAGHTFTDDETEAEAAIVNTCCFIGDAQMESIENILSLSRYRQEGKYRALIVTGCLAQRYKEEILREIPEVDAVIGITSEEHLVSILDDVVQKQETHKLLLGDPNGRTGTDSQRVLTTGGYYSYLKIAEGCDKGCTYCVIPSVRGKYRSYPMEKLLAEAAYLAGQGVKELILVAQETTLYGTDLYGEKKLPELLRKLSEIEGIEWIRLLYCYPEEITDALLETIRDTNKVLPYLDLPIQHASDEILKRMGRHTTQEQLEAKIAQIRNTIPQVCLRTTLIAGFPGETEEDHEILLDFVRRMQFDRLGVFTYSREDGTPAAAMKGQIPARVKKKRQKQLMLAQQEIAFAKAEAMEGLTLTAMVEGRIAGEDVYTARTYKDAPGVDGLLFIETGRELMTGDLVQVRVTGAQDYDLIGEPV